MTFPTGLTVGPDGAFYVSDQGFGFPAGQGQVLEDHHRLKQHRFVLSGAGFHRLRRGGTRARDGGSAFHPYAQNRAYPPAAGAVSPAIPCTLAPHDACSWPRPLLRRSSPWPSRAPPRGDERASARRAKAGSILVGFKPGVTAPAQADVCADEARPTKKFAPIHGALVSVTRDHGGRFADSSATRASPTRSRTTSSTRPTSRTIRSSRGSGGCNNTGQTVNSRRARPTPTSTRRRPGPSRPAAPNVVVAVIDTGVDVAHPDLAANMWVNRARTAPAAARTASTTTATATSTTGAAGTSSTATTTRPTTTGTERTSRARSPRSATTASASPA